MFKENDYIVQLHESKSNYLLKNHIYQQNTNSDQLRTNKDSTNRECNSSYVFYYKPETWRYATPEEIEEYNKRGEPYDVTTLEPKSLVGRYFKALKKNIQGSCTIEGNYYKIIEDREYSINFYTEKCPKTLLGISKDYLHTIELMPEGFDFNKSEIPMNTYGLKVGDKLPESVIRKWTFIGKNYYIGTWKSNSSVFSGDRKILSFKMLDGIVGFEVSQTADVYLRAEGFKEFMKNGLNVKEKISINTNEFQIGDELEAIGNWNGFNAKPGSKAIVVSNLNDTEDYFFRSENRKGVDIQWVKIIDLNGKELPLNKQSNGLYDRENFKKIEFKLPEKWYVKATKENEEVLKQWRGGSYTGWKDDLCVNSNRYWELSSYCSKQGFVEITYEQFQKYVLYKKPYTDSESLSEQYKDTEGDIITKFYQQYSSEKCKECSNTGLTNALSGYNACSHCGGNGFTYNKKSEELIIPQLKKEKIKINFDLSTTKTVDIQINLSKKQTKQVKQIKIEKFNLSL